MSHNPFCENCPLSPEDIDYKNPFKCNYHFYYYECGNNETYVIRVCKKDNREIKNKLDYY